MAKPSRADLQSAASECVTLVAQTYQADLDYSLDSLVTLDWVCEQLLADGPLSEPQFVLWCRLAGAYTGEVCLRAYGGEWVERNDATAILVQGITGLPFNTASRVLRGEEWKSLASFGRAIPAIVENSQRRRSDPA